jgi:hypothetical protein
MNIVIAREKGSEGRPVRIADTMSDDWHLTQARWRWLDKANREGRLYVEDDRRDGHLYLKPVQLNWLAVRELEDPAIAKTSTIALFVVGKGKGARDRGSLERRWGKAHGYHGHVGGWVYKGFHPSACRLINQGWRTVVPRRAIGAVLAPGNVRHFLIEDIREVTVDAD